MELDKDSIKKIYSKINLENVHDFLQDYENENLDNNEIAALFQYLINNGLENELSSADISFTKNLIKEGYGV